MSLPDGEYILTCDVRNPLPQRLHSRRRGWWRAARWHQGTHFTIEGGVWSANTHRGHSNIGLGQRQKIRDQIEPHLQPWVPSTPSEIIAHGTYSDSDDVLDVLFGLGKITLDDVHEAMRVRKVLLAIQHGLQDLCDPGDPPVGAAIPAEGLVTAEALLGAPPSPTAIGNVLRPGDVILDREGSPANNYVVVRLVSTGIYEWQDQNGCESFEQGWKSYREPHVGHVADMLASGLGALSAPLLVLGFDHNGNSIHCGHVLRHMGCRADDPLTQRLRVVGRGVSDVAGARVRVVQLSGPQWDLDSISIAPGHVWIIDGAALPEAATAILGYDTDGNPVRVGYVLTCVNDPKVRLVVTAQEIVDPTHPATNKGPYVTFRYLSGSGVGFDHVSLCKGNKWRVVAIPTEFEQHQTPTPPADRAPRRDQSIDPFSLD